MSTKSRTIAASRECPGSVGAATQKGAAIMDDSHDAHGHQVPSAAFRQHLRRKLTSEVRQPELEGSNNGNACEFDGRPNGDVDRIWALQAVPYATSPYRGRHTDPPRQPRLRYARALLERPGELVCKEELHSASAVGRPETVHEQVQKLQRRRLLTIVGSGGSNTTIAFTLAGKLIEAHDNGVWLVGSSPRRCLRSRTGHPDLTPPFADV